MTIAVYAGSFDPFTTGHRWVVSQAAGLFAGLHVVVADNEDKQALFTSEERVEMIAREVADLPHVSVDVTHGMVVDFARGVGATVLVRGFRGGQDADDEIRVAQENRELAPQLVTLVLPTLPELRDVSSSRLKELARSGADLSAHCSAHVARCLRDKLGS